MGGCSTMSYLSATLPRPRFSTSGTTLRFVSCMQLHGRSPFHTITRLLGKGRLSFLGHTLRVLPAMTHLILRLSGIHRLVVLPWSRVRLRPRTSFSMTQTQVRTDLAISGIVRPNESRGVRCTYLMATPYRDTTILSAIRNLRKSVLICGDSLPDSPYVGFLSSSTFGRSLMALRPKSSRNFFVVP